MTHSPWTLQQGECRSTLQNSKERTRRRKANASNATEKDIGQKIAMQRQQLLLRLKKENTKGKESSIIRRTGKEKARNDGLELWKEKRRLKKKKTTMTKIKKKLISTSLTI